MKKIYLILFLILPFSCFSQSVLGKLKQKVKDRVERRTDESMDKALDKTEEKIKAEKNKPSESQKEQKEAAKESIKAEESGPKQASANNESFQSYSRYDFVPGEHLVYAEDFSQDVIGEFPLLWKTNNRGEVVTVKGQSGHWLRLFHNGRFLSPSIKNLPENFTIEFDMIMTFQQLNYVYPEIKIQLLNLGNGDANAKEYVSNNALSTYVETLINPGDEESSTISLQSYKSNEGFFKNDPKGLKKLGSNFGKPFHVSIWIQKERLRLWINGDKIYDVPQAVPPQANFNRFAFDIGNAFYEDEQIGLYVSNICIAEGTADLRSKLMTEGKLVTNGILFDVASDKIKPESFGVLQELAKTLQDNPTVKIKITGHTDSDGEADKNLDLSKRRAIAVKEALSSHFSIDASRMETDGKGESQPIADNKSKEGKAKNRRVEFIKL